LAQATLRRRREEGGQQGPAQPIDRPPCLPAASLMCEEGGKNFFYKIHCTSRLKDCPLCGQTVCEYHGASNNNGAVGGHSNCRGRCRTSYPQKCQGFMAHCGGCGQAYCAEHLSKCEVCAGGGLTGMCSEGSCGDPVVQPCILCGQRVCQVHAASHNGHAKGGHHGCSGTCGSDFPAECKGYMQRCCGCNASFCTHHIQQAGPGRRKGGHRCKIYCHTTPIYADNCAGEICRCPRCNCLYCQYHLKANESIMDFIGGHVCKGTGGSDLVTTPASFTSPIVDLQADSVFEGRVFRGGMRNMCVVSFPGKYVDMWNLLVRSCKDRTLSSACVFLPKEDPKKRFGEHAADPEGRGRCYCHALYGGVKPWGCEWFKDWRANVEDAVRLELELVVVYFPGKVGQGIVPWEDLAREGENLWKRPGGLGGSQKGEVAFLAKKGWHFRGVDVDEMCGWFGITR